MSSPQHLFIFRHGQTDWNREGRIQGQLDMPLNDIGRQQAHELGKNLADKKIQLIISSDLSRAIQTASIVAEYTQCPIVLESAFKEMHFGTMQGKTATELMLHPLVSYFIQDIPAYDHVGFPGGETKKQLKERLHKALELMLLTVEHERIALSTHGIVLSGIIRYLTNGGAEPKGLSNGEYVHLSRSASATLWHLQP